MNNTKSDERKLNDFIIPAADVYENQDEFLIKVEMPGVKKEDVSLVYENGYLELTGKIQKEWEKDYEIVEREFGLMDYYRRFFVGNKIDSGNIAVKLENGVLSMKLAKSENLKPRKIEVTS